MASFNRNILFGFVVIILCCTFRTCNTFPVTAISSRSLGRYSRTAFNCENERVAPPTIMLLSRKDPKMDDEQQSAKIVFLPLASAAVIVVAFWPLLALLRDTNDPTSGFDIDMFMALKGILDGGGNALNYYEDIVELPPLSPAEQLVGAIFGPP